MIVVHRLLKNEVVEGLGIDAYALFSQACIDASDLDPVALGMRRHAETYDRIGEVPVWVLDLERRWQEEEARGRVFVAPDASILTVTVPTDVPPQVAWEFLTKPGQRMSWQPWVTEVRSRAPPAAAADPVPRTTACTARTRSSRRSSTGDRTTTSPTARSSPRRRVRSSSSTPWSSSRAPTGTTIHMRYARRRPRRSGSSPSTSDAYGEALRSSIPSLVEQLDAAFAARETDGGPEPELAATPGRPPVRAGAAGDDRLRGYQRWPRETRRVRRIEIDGGRCERDVVVDRGRVGKRHKKASKPLRDRYGHTPLSLLEPIPWDCRRLIVGHRGRGALPIDPDVVDGGPAGGGWSSSWCRPTKRARSSADADPETTNAILHVTC